MADNDHVLVINRPGPETESRYILVVYRPMPFGYAPVLFAVDEFTALTNQQGNPTHYVGTAHGNTVVQFPVTFDYMLIDRNGVKFMESKDLKKELGEEEEAPAGPAARRFEYI